MKKILYIFLACVLLLGALFSAVSCAAKTDINAGQPLLLTATSFINNSHEKHTNAEMNAAYDTLRLEKNIDTNYGYLCKTIRYYVAAGTYTFSANVRVSSGNSNDTVVQLHVLNGSKVIANLNIMGPSKASAFQEYGITFTIPSNARLEFGIYTNGRNDVEMTEMRVEASEKVDSSLLIDLLKEDAEDRKIEFDEDAVYYMDLLPKVLELVDYSYQEQIMTLVSVLQGLINRDKPRLYVNFLDRAEGNTGDGQDDFWYDYLASKDFLPERTDAEFVTVKSVGTLLRIFSAFYDGLTVWDYNVPSTYNVGMTDCGINNRLLVKYTQESNSVYRYLTEELGMQVKLDLVDKFNGKAGTKIWNTDIDSTGSKKCDPYVWAVEEYIKTGKTNPTTLSAYLDGWVGDNGVTQRVYYDETGTVCYGTGGIPHWTERYLQTDIMNRDYFISQKAFFYDLSPVSGDAPIDDLNQPLNADPTTLELILSETNKRLTKSDGENTDIIEVGGFTNWQLKYSDASKEGAIDGGALEPSMVRLLTKYNATMQADASSLSLMANASVYTHYPAKQQYDQSAVTEPLKEKAKTAKLENKNYLLIYMGDYDGSAWINHKIRYYFEDPNINTYPLMWPIDAVNETRVGHVYDWLYEQQAERNLNNVIFVGGNNGYGYNYLDVLIDPASYGWDRTGIQGTFDEYINTAKKAYDKYDLDVMGMYFGGWDASQHGDPASTGYYKIMYEGLAKLSPYGVVTSRGRTAFTLEDYFIANTANEIYGGTVFMCKDVFNGADTTIQCGNGSFLADGTAQHQVSVLSQSMNVTRAGAPGFHVLRPVLASPTQVAEGIQNLQTRYPEYQFEVVDPYTFFKLYKDFLDGVVAGKYDDILNNQSNIVWGGQ